MKSPHRHRVRAWLTLLRAPNLLTVPGDPLAGYLLAGFMGGALVPLKAMLVMAAALLLYASGLIANDLVDLDRDRRVHPGRPLPAGHIRPIQAILAAGACAGGGLLLAFAAGLFPGCMAMLLFVCVVCYTFSGKALPVIGPLWMGACRAFSLLMGAAAAGALPALNPPGIAALGLLFYVAALTAVARHEDRTRHPGYLVWLPFAALLSGFSWMFTVMIASPWAYGLAVAACLNALGIAVLSYRSPSAPRKAVGGFIRGILLYQAALLALGAPPPGALLTLLPLAAWPLHRQLSRRFPPT